MYLYMTELGQYAYNLKRVDEPIRLAPFACLYLHFVACCWRKPNFNPILPQVTFPWLVIISCTEIITDGVNGHDPEMIGWFRLVYAKREAIGLRNETGLRFISPRLKMGRSQNWPDLRWPQCGFLSSKTWKIAMSSFCTIKGNFLWQIMWYHFQNPEKWHSRDNHMRSAWGIFGRGSS